MAERTATDPELQSQNLWVKLPFCLTLPKSHSEIPATPEIKITYYLHQRDRKIIQKPEVGKSEYWVFSKHSAGFAALTSSYLHYYVTL